MSAGVREESPAPSGLPLFYRKPELLTPQRHAQLRLRAEGDLRFAAECVSVPIAISEFSPAMRSYPIVFAGDHYPIAVLGLQQRNLFLTEDGQWLKGHYVPAYVRRYPFVPVDGVGEKGPVLGIDMACERLMPSAGAPADAAAFFENEQPTQLTRDAANFCAAYHADHEATRAFGSALAQQTLLVDQHAKASLPDGRTLAVQGFRVVDRERLANLPDALVTEWHRKGWLALITLHLNSLDRLNLLLDLMATSRVDGNEPAAATARG